MHSYTSRGQAEPIQKKEHPLPGSFHKLLDRSGFTGRKPRSYLWAARSGYDRFVTSIRRDWKLPRYWMIARSRWRTSRLLGITSKMLPPLTLGADLPQDDDQVLL